LPKPARLGWEILDRQCLGDGAWERAGMGRVTKKGLEIRDQIVVAGVEAEVANCMPRRRPRSCAWEPMRRGAVRRTLRVRKFSVLLSRGPPKLYVTLSSRSVHRREPISSCAGGVPKDLAALRGDFGLWASCRDGGLHIEPAPHFAGGQRGEVERGERAIVVTADGEVSASMAVRA